MALLLVAAPAAALCAAAGGAPYTYTVLPGQKLARDVTWYVADWKGECVLKRAPDGSCCPFAVVTPPGGAACPAGSAFNFTGAVEEPWRPFPAGGAPPATHVFAGVEKGLLHDPLCLNNADAVRNRDLLNAALAGLSPGDTLSIPGSYCVAAGVVGDRLTHATIDVAGELFFSQGPGDWEEGATGIQFYGATNLTITSSTRKGLIHAKGCTLWYLQRDMGKAGGPALFHVDMDRNLTFASSRLTIEHLRVHDGPGYQMYINKAVDVTVRYMDVRVTCIPRAGTIPDALMALAQQTDGIDIWGANVHVHDVNVANGDDCICVKGGEDGSGIISENWLVENSTASGEGITVGTLGWGGRMPVRNVTFRNIHMPSTTKGIYVKPPHNNVTGVLYQNITIEGEALQFPVFIGPIHQFSGDCPWNWPMPGTGTCSAPRDAMTVDVKIDGLRIVRPLPKVVSRIEGSTDFLIMGSERMKVRVALSNIEVVGAAPKRCDDPPMALTGTCGNTCYAAEVVTDGSYDVECTPFGSKVADGACAPVIGRVGERCPTGAAHKDSGCIASGLRCNATA